MNVSKTLVHPAYIYIRRVFVGKVCC